MSVWRLHDLIAQCGGHADRCNDCDVRGLSIDTRSLVAGDVFIALAGDHSDGHAYVDAAFERGAVAAVVNHSVATLSGSGCQIIVPDTLKALESLAVAARERVQGRDNIFAITGSVGKTGVRAMMELALAEFGAVHASIKSYNNHWGVPLSLANMPQASQFGVFEVGMSHANEIVPLAKMIVPNIGIITAIEAQHIENFDSIDGIADAKSELFQGMDTNSAVVLPADSPHLGRLIDNAKAANLTRIFTFGVADNADAKLLDCTVNDAGSQAIVMIDGQAVSLSLPVMGEHLLRNAAAVMLAVHVAGFDPTVAAQTLSHYQTPDGRGRMIWLNGESDAVDSIGLMDETYNAAPVAVKAGLTVLDALHKNTDRKRQVVLGDIYELGDREEHVIDALADQLQILNIRTVHACGPMMEKLLKRLPEHMRGLAVADHTSLGEALVAHISPGDLVMIKGSRGGGQKPRMQVVLEDLEKGLRAQLKASD